jgi:hypothetical protein
VFRLVMPLLIESSGELGGGGGLPHALTFCRTSKWLFFSCDFFFFFDKEVHIMQALSMSLDLAVGSTMRCRFGRSHYLRKVLYNLYRLQSALRHYIHLTIL